MSDPNTNGSARNPTDVTSQADAEEWYQVRDRIINDKNSERHSHENGTKNTNNGDKSTKTRSEQANQHQDRNHMQLKNSEVEKRDYTRKEPSLDNSHNNVQETDGCWDEDDIMND